MGDFNRTVSNVHQEVTHRVRLLGTGSAPTVEFGPNITVTRTAAGVYKLTWAEFPGTFINFGWGLGAATPSDVKGHTVTRDTFDTTSGVGSLEVSLWNSSFAADDLQATEYMDLTIVFAATGSP